MFYRFSMWAQTFGLSSMSYNKLDVCSVGTDRVWKCQNQLLCTIMSYKVPHLWCNKICKHIYCLTQLTVTTWNIHSFTLNSSSANHISALLQTTDCFAHSCSIFETCVCSKWLKQSKLKGGSRIECRMSRFPFVIDRCFAVESVYTWQSSIRIWILKQVSTWRTLEEKRMRNKSRNKGKMSMLKKIGERKHHLFNGTFLLLLGLEKYCFMANFPTLHLQNNIL